MSYQLESKLMRVREGEGSCDGGSLSCAEMGHQKRRPDVRSPAFGLVSVEGDIAKAVGHMELEFRAQMWQREEAGDSSHVCGPGSQSCLGRGPSGRKPGQDRSGHLQPSLGIFPSLP